MLAFQCDYAQGAAEEILAAISRANREGNLGYELDPYCDRAKEKIRAACGCPEADIYFLNGGTQTNQIVISSMLPLYAGVIAADTGHISVHEAGAIEATGHKILAIPHDQGKLRASALEAYLKGFYLEGTPEQMVYPGMVYISHPTELGTLYTKAELEAIKAVCQTYQLPLYLDGARLGYGIMSDGTDVTLRDIAAICDAFYIGGTKVGALFGEAAVFPRNNAPAHFYTMMRRLGGLPAKGFLLGLQFDALFTDGLYWRLSRHAIEAANHLRETLRRKGYKFYIESDTNQIFVVMENQRLQALQDAGVCASVWERPDETHTIVRFVTSWATEDGQLGALEGLL